MQTIVSMQMRYNKLNRKVVRSRALYNTEFYRHTCFSPRKGEPPLIYDAAEETILEKVARLKAEKLDVEEESEEELQLKKKKRSVSKRPKPQEFNDSDPY